MLRHSSLLIHCLLNPDLSLADSQKISLILLAPNHFFFLWMSMEHKIFTTNWQLTLGIHAYFYIPTLAVITSLRECSTTLNSQFLIRSKGYIFIDLVNTLFLFKAQLIFFRKKKSGIIFTLYIAPALNNSDLIK